MHSCRTTSIWQCSQTLRLFARVWLRETSVSVIDWFWIVELGIFLTINLKQSIVEVSSSESASVLILSLLTYYFQCICSWAQDVGSPGWSQWLMLNKVALHSFKNSSQEHNIPVLWICSSHILHCFCAIEWVSVEHYSTA